MTIPAIEGGMPVRQTFLPYGKQWIDEQDIQQVVDVLKSDFITQGPVIDKFEQAVARYVGAKYAVAFSNGTAALHGACFAADIQAGDEVITSPITFAASSNSVIYQGGTPVFADIRHDSYNIDPDEIKNKINPKTKALIPVDFSGQPVEIDTIMDIARKHQLVVIEDAAHALGAEYAGRKVGCWADMTMFSFHPVKHITTGEGGIITTDNEAYYQKLKLFRSHGITKDPERLLKNDGPWYHEMQALGYNYRMTDLQAALGLSQLNKLDDFVQRRREIVQSYQDAFQSLPGIQIPFEIEKSNSSWHLYVLRFDSTCFRTDRKQLFQAFRAENIGVQVHYIPVYHHPYYQQHGYGEQLCQAAENFYREVISIPLFPKMTGQDVQDVIEAVKKIHKFYVHV